MTEVIILATIPSFPPAKHTYAVIPNGSSLHTCNGPLGWVGLIEYWAMRRGVSGLKPAAARLVVVGAMACVHMCVCARLWPWGGRANHTSIDWSTLLKGSGCFSPI